jgi:hypothetical protein
VRIRPRNPCFFLRFRLFGWKVRFTHGLLERGVVAGNAGRRRSRTRNAASARGVYWRRARARNAGADARRSAACPAARGSTTPTRGVDNPRVGPPTRSARNGGRLPHDPRATVQTLGTTPPIARNYSRETRDCSLEWPGVGC